MFNETLMNVVNEGDKITNVSKTKVNAVPDSGFQLMKKEGAVWRDSSQRVKPLSYRRRRT